MQDYMQNRVEEERFWIVLERVFKIRRRFWRKGPRVSVFCSFGRVK